MEDMPQNSSTVNFLINDANGNPQMIKVLPSNINKSLVATGKPNTIKFMKVANQGEGSNQEPTYHAVSLPELEYFSKKVHLPTNALSQLHQLKPIKIEQTDNKKEYAEIKYIDSLPDILPNREVPELLSTTKLEPSIGMSHASRRRHDSDNDQPTEYTTKRRKHADKVGKGLRHFSMKVCEKVRNKGFTSYNEVADELVLEFATGIHGSADSQQYDQKNIRRRVYDALNVLMAMNIISKEKKEIRWLGLPTNSVQECTSLEKEKQAKLEQIQKKTQQLQELILQHISFKSLIERNKEAENKGLKPSPSSAIHLPFIVVNTSDKALIDCSISNDKTEYMFNFNKRFQIHDDIDILKRMGLLFGLDKGECSEEDIERAKQMTPKSLEYYVEQMGRGVITKLTSLLEDDEVDEMEDEEAVPDAAADELEDEPQDYSDDSSDVDV